MQHNEVRPNVFQYGDYVVELLSPSDWWHVRMAGGDPSNPISVHDSKQAAIEAVRGYKLGDQRKRHG